MYITRREFGLCAGGLSAFVPAAAQDPAPWSEPAVVRKVYLAVPQPTWPYPRLDVNQEMRAVEAGLAPLEKTHAAGVRFTGGEMLRSAEDAQAFAKSLGDVDAVLIIDLTSGTGGMLSALRAIDVPVLLFSRPYSGWSYVDVAGWAQSGKKADLLVTSEFGDLDPYMRMFRTIRHMRKSKVLVVSPGGGSRAAEGFTKQFGTAIEFPGYKEVQAAYESVPPAEAEKAAQEFTRGALRVVEPSPREISDALRFYFGIVKLLRQARANAITIDCLGGFRRGDLPAYPCVAWSKLNDSGMYGVCEADLHSTISQLLLTSYTGKPGFVSDPVFDTSRNEIIHAHCVAATAMQGMEGPRCAYAIRSHMEDNKGVSLQVIMPASGTVTAGKFLDPGRFAVSTGEVLGNVDYERGCRTKVRTRVADARKMLESYTGGLHRVVVYGDYVRPIEQMGRLMGFRVVRES